AGGLDNGHFLAPAVSPPQVFRPLVDPRAGLQRPPSADPAFENRWRPLRPAPDVTEIRPHLTDAAGDLYPALGSYCHGADFTLITFRLRKDSRDATAWLRRLQVRSDGGRIRQISGQCRVGCGLDVAVDLRWVWAFEHA